MGSPEPPRRYRHSHDAAFMAGYDTPPEFTPDEPVPPDGTRLDLLHDELDRLHEANADLRERVNQLEEALREIKAMGFGEGGGSASGYECAKFAERVLSAAGEDAK